MFRLSKVAIAFFLVLMPLAAFALEFKSVAVPKAILYDAPSGSAKKILLLSQHYPVEVVVDLGAWLKIRDAEGGMSWIEAKNVSDQRTVMVRVGQAEIRQSADTASNLIATLEKDVLLEVVDAKLNNGWLRVKHRDGLTGYILISSTWGFN